MSIRNVKSYKTKSKKVVVYPIRQYWKNLSFGMTDYSHVFLVLRNLNKHLKCMLITYAPVNVWLWTCIRLLRSDISLIHTGNYLFKVLIRHLINVNRHCSGAFVFDFGQIFVWTDKWFIKQSKYMSKQSKH